MAEEEVPVYYEDLANIEAEFDEVDTEIMRQQYVMSAPIYEKRQQVISKIPNFWPLVFELAPPEIDHYIQPTDSEIIGKALSNLEVKRFEADGGDPRSLQFRFEFAENDWFTDKVLEKKFWYRRAKNGWAGLVSEPVKINWKKGKDTTSGLMDGAVKLWEARKKAGDMNKKDLKEYSTMAKLVENWNGENTSFFTWFAFVCAAPYVTAEESAEATKEMKEAKAKADKGEKEEEKDEPDAEDLIDLEPGVEVHEAGDDLANLIAEDLWPGAIKYFTQAQEAADMSDFDMEDDEDDEDEDDDDDGPIDIRSLVQAKGGDEPPNKRQKK
ncbi:hypothetical protein AAFC00_003280 [Neodothiora populina]|uniref:Uncharacterized protein n=1 Tax=Neodothiora populina TaxID=2781224 RepID=A0ABR3PA81_9PEZI